MIDSNQRYDKIKSNKRIIRLELILLTYDPESNISNINSPVAQLNTDVKETVLS